MLAGGNEKFPPANILSFLPSHYNDYHAFVSSTEHGFFRILGEMSLRGQEMFFPNSNSLAANRRKSRFENRD